MLELFYTGIIIGVLVSCPMGPMGMLCIQRTLSKGKLSGFISGLGAAFSDILYAALTCFFVGLVDNFIQANQRPFQIFGSVVILLFGYYIFRNNPAERIHRNHEQKQTLVQDFVTAFLLTFSNILIVLLFIGLYARYTFVLPEHSIQMTVSGLLGVLAGAVLWWILITFIVSFMRNWFNVKGLKIMNRIMGTIIMIFALVGFVSSIWFFVK